MAVSRELGGFEGVIAGLCCCHFFVVAGRMDGCHVVFFLFYGRMTATGTTLEQRNPFPIKPRECKSVTQTQQHKTSHYLTSKCQQRQKTEGETSTLTAFFK